MPEKWAQHTGSSDRILGLYTLLLFSNRKYSLTRLSEIFDCSKQTIMRHIEQIQKRSEIELIDEIEGNQRYISVKRPKRDANITIDSESLEYFSLCRDIVAHLLPGEVHQEIGRALAAASFVLSPDEAPAQGNNHFAGIFTKGAIDYSPKQKVIESIMKSIRETRWVDCEYISTTKNSTRSIRMRPLKLVAYREGLYLMFNDEKDPKPRMLPLQRVEHLEISAEKFDASLLETIKVPDTFGVISGETFEVTARVSANATQYVVERVWSEDQSIRSLDDDGVELTFTSTSELEVIAWVLGFAGEVELLEPNHLRDILKNRLVRMLEIHGIESTTS